MSEVYDLADKIRSRLASQFKESTRLRGFIEALASEIPGLEVAAFECLVLRTLDAATGAQLDILGVLVGQPREVVDASDLYYFGYVGAYHALGYGAARYAVRGEVTDGVRYLEDVEYREFIRARIARNSCKGTINEILSLVEFMIGGTPGDPVVYINELSNAKLQVSIGASIDINRRLLLLEGGLFPKPAGVGVDFSYFQTPPFAYSGAPGAAAYGTGYYATTTGV